MKYDLRRNFLKNDFSDGFFFKKNKFYEKLSESDLKKIISTVLLKVIK